MGRGDAPREPAIDLVQFEFGVASMGSRIFFRDLYNLLALHFGIHRIVRNRLAPVDHHVTARGEIFATAGNFLAVSREIEFPLRVASLRSSAIAAGRSRLVRFTQSPERS